MQGQLSRTCPGKLDAFLGGTASNLDLSRFTVVWFSPTLDESDLGADWFRCDLIAFAGKEKLLTLPADGLRAVLTRPGALSTYGLWNCRAG